MCGRYQFTKINSEELDSILRTVEKRCGRDELNFPMAGDICPATKAPVLLAHGDKVTADLLTWGMPVKSGRLIINARAETVTEKPLFKRSILAQRCIIPTTGFFEFDVSKHKYLFRLPGQPLYLAGIYDNFSGVDCFVILTTAPNLCMAGIHDRMPLVVAKEKIRPWLTDPSAALELLTKAPPMLERTCVDGQLRMEDLS